MAMRLKSCVMIQDVIEDLDEHSAYLARPMVADWPVDILA